MKTFVSSDFHFFHANIIKYCDRPFSDVNEMNQALMDNWNEVVSPEDEIYVLGDFLLGKYDQLEVILSSLNGAKRTLVRGNHDRFTAKKYLEAGFTEVTHRLVLDYKGKKIWMSHYPPYDERRQTCSYYNILLHGHSHSPPDTCFKVINGKICLDVGIDGSGYFPYNLDDILEMEKNI